MACHVTTHLASPQFLRGCFIPLFPLRLNRDGKWGFTLSLNMQFCVKFTGRRSVWQKTLRVSLSSALLPPNHPVNFYRGPHFYWLFYFSKEFVDDAPNSWSRRWRLGSGFEWWKRGRGLNQARSWLGGDPILPGLPRHSYGPSSAEVWTENSIHRGVFSVACEKYWTC